jgi:nucleoside-diphosphate-sugar epimerase
MRNVIDACKEHNARLVFFDNVYMYGKVNGWMTEETPMNPCSKKGEIRARIADMLLGEMRAGNVQALIARSADFYGPETPNSFFNEMVLKNLAKGKKAQLLVSATKRHSMTYTRDAGKATAILGRTPEAFQQIWHLPTDKNALTSEELTRIAAEAFGVKNQYTVLSRTMLRFIGLFNGVVKESVEMLYQNEDDYLFDSSKFDNAFGVQPTSYADGIRETVRIVRAKPLNVLTRA